jgi:hypothetical protein
MQGRQNEESRTKLAGTSVRDPRRSSLSARSRRLNLRGSNRQFLVRLESAVTFTKQTPESISNRHIWDGCRIMFTASASSKRISNSNTTACKIPGDSMKTHADQFSNRSRTISPAVAIGIATSVTLS